MKWLKYATITALGISAVAIGTFYTDKVFPAFLVAWLLLIPMATVVYLIYGLRKYIKERRNNIVVSIKPSSATEKLVELIHKEEEIKHTKEKLYKEIKRDKSSYRGKT